MSASSTWSHSQRFFPFFPSNGIPAAAPTLGSPAMLHRTDTSVFKKSMEEKMKIYTFKKELGKTKNHHFNRVAIGDY